jgi:hypothetical protein
MRRTARTRQLVPKRLLLVEERSALYSEGEERASGREVKDIAFPPVSYFLRERESSGRAGEKPRR